jgi:coenzyme F420-reducing hydrogenase delta subunit
MPSQSSRCTSSATAEDRGGPAPAAVTIFLCANCARPAQAPTSAGRPRPAVANFEWPWPVREVLLPCTGRLQPEHVLKAFESGADLVCAIACREDNCHYVEGSQRCARRVDYIHSILREIGLGGERLLFFTLPGTAAEDMALAAGRSMPAACPDDLQFAAVRNRVRQALDDLPPNPLHAMQTDKEILISCQEGENDED